MLRHRRWEQNLDAGGGGALRKSAPMARFFVGERDDKQRGLLQWLRVQFWGLRESEIAEDLGWQRCTVNNYLRDLQKRGQVYKEGTRWLTLPYQQAELRKFKLSPQK